MTYQLDIECVDTAEMCRLLGRTTKWWWRYRKELYAKHGFPLQLPGPGNPIWRRDDIIAWRDRKPVAPAPAERADHVAADVLQRAGLS